MKKILVTALLMAGSFGLVNAQAKQKPAVEKTTKTTTLKAAPTKTTHAPVVKMNQTQATTTTHVKADGSADKRYKENKTTKTTAAGPLKKNGTPDMRYNANKKK